MSLVEKLKSGCIQAQKRWSGDCGEISLVDEHKTDAVMAEAAKKIEELQKTIDALRAEIKEARAGEGIPQGIQSPVPACGGNQQARPTNPNRRNKMSEQEKTESKPKKTAYTLEWDGNGWAVKCPNGEIIETRSDELNSLLARAEKAEAERDEFKRRAGNAEFELKRQKDLMNPIDWNRVRIDAAIAAMQALLPDIREFPYSPEWVVQHADALVAELKKEVAE